MMDFQNPLYIHAVPEIILLVASCAALLGHLYFGHRYKMIAYGIVQLGLIAAFGAAIMNFDYQSVTTFNGLFVSDGISKVLKLFIYATVFTVFLYSRQYVVERGMARGEYFVLGLFSTLGMSVLVSAASFISIYLGLELLSLPLYAMVALERDSVKATEAAMKYFVMGAVASGMMLYGMSMLYGATGQLELTKVASAISSTPADKQLIMVFALVFVIAGLGFKLAAAPFHMWAPDVYSGAPNSVALLIATAPKLAAMGMAVRLLLFATPSLFLQWQHVLIAMSILSMGIGNLLAIVQTNIKRMLAYSAIAHIGYLLLGFIPGTAAGHTAALFYILMYAIMSAGAFGMIVLMSRNGSDIETIEDFRGLNTRSPWLAFMMLLVMFSLAGIPPTVGFIAKLFLLQALVNANLTWLALVALVFAIIGVFYYIRIVKQMYFEAPVETSSTRCPVDMQILISVNGLLLLVLGIFPGFILQACGLAMAGV